MFAVITDPAGHVKIDGSGMLVAAQDSAPLTGVGDSFVMNMDREALGDIPLGKYQVRNTVTAFVPDELFEWNVGGVDQPPFGHVYGYRLEPRSDGATVVTHYVDSSGVRRSSKGTLYLLRKRVAPESINVAVVRGNINGIGTPNCS